MLTWLSGVLHGHLILLEFSFGCAYQLRLSSHHLHPVCMDPQLPIDFVVIAHRSLLSLL